MPRTSEQFETMRQESRKIIKQSALELFAENGFDGTSIRQIAEKANISKGLLYNYYNSKDDLLQEILADASKIGDDIFMEAFHAAENDPSVLVEVMIDSVFAFMESNTEYMRLLFSLSMKKDIAGKYEQLLEQSPEKKLAAIVGHLEDIGVDNAKLKALYIGAIMDGISLQYIHLKDQYPITEMKNFVKSNIVDNLKKENKS